MNNLHTPSIAATCPANEHLLAMLTNGLVDDERHDLDAHLEHCDRCLDTVTLLHRRLALDNDVARAVPAAVIERASVALGCVPAPAALSATWATTAGIGARLADFRERLTAVVRWPALVPVAAAAALMLVVSQTSWMAPQAPRELSRAVAGHQHLRVTAREAVVRSQPSGRADVVATVTRGTVVDVGGEERDWYRVSLPNGTGGWVDRHAFE